MSNLNPIAEIETIDSGNIVTPDEARTLTTNLFFCPDFDCKDPDRKLKLKKSKLSNNFFSHLPKYEHDIRPETLLHKLAIKWFENKASFEIPGYSFSTTRLKTQTLELDIKETILEYSQLKLVIPDVKLKTLSGFEFAIEIVVTNDVSDQKKRLIEQFNLPTLVIDLGEFYSSHPKECRVDKVFIQTHLDSLLTDKELKRWVLFPESSLNSSGLETELKQTGADNIGCLILLPFIGIVSVINKLFNWLF